jgi:hypothetical protein
MATKSYARYNSTDVFAASTLVRQRRLDVWVDFTVAANQLAAASDTLNLFHVPVGTVIAAGGIEQLAAGASGNTVKLRVGSVDLSATLASDAAVGTQAGDALLALTGDAQTPAERPMTITTAADVNLLSASAIRSTGRVRCWIIVLEADGPVNEPALAQRDNSV